MNLTSVSWCKNNISAQNIKFNLIQYAGISDYKLIVAGLVPCALVLQIYTSVGKYVLVPRLLRQDFASQASGLYRRLKWTAELARS